MYFIADESKRLKSVGIVPTYEEKWAACQWHIFDQGKDPNEFAYFFGEEGTIIAVKAKFDPNKKSIEIDKENPFTIVNVKALM